MKQQTKPTRAYKIGHTCAVKQLPPANPFAPGSSRFKDFNRGYSDRISEAKRSGLPYTEYDLEEC